MAAITVRNLPDETHRALKARARRHDRSTEAEIRAILTEAVQLDSPTRVGSVLAAIGAEAGGDPLKIPRDRTPYTPRVFS
ncbi:Arc family DNA-binding protein [Luteococcus sp. H138]|uniref:FitA-like ribbon-helix-helix domain-containing protein n=1 Tax=unclassified Luteococcus TaxID=2639923 RepID=UPI00313E7F3E